ncbi:MAG: hypothetical protein ACREMB_24350 [Candidatus Rokuibacteriota bacterium]
MSRSTSGPRWRRAALVAGLAALFPLAGCAGPLKQIARNVQHLYRADSLNGSLPKQRVAVLLASSRPELGQWRQSASDALVGVLREEGPDLAVVPWEETVSRINAEEITDAYAEMLSLYETTGILKKTHLRRIGTTLNSRYIAQPVLITFTERSNTRLGFFGLRLVETREATARGRLQIWDTEEAKIVWTAESEATLAGENVLARPIGFEVIRYVWQDLVRQLLVEDARLAESGGPGDG